MKPIERISVVEQVIERLEEYITENNLKKGDKMPTEKEVCEMLEAGRSTVREAYRMMQALGIIEVKRGKGVYFVRLQEDAREAEVAEWFRSNGQHIADYMQVRCAIESMAVKVAMQKMNEQKINQLKELCQKAMQDIDTKIGKRRAMRMTLYDEEFHHMITEMTGNDLLIKIERNIAECLTDYRNQVFMLEENIERAHTSHRKIIEAFENGNEELALERVSNHLESSLKDMEYVEKENRK